MIVWHVTSLKKLNKYLQNGGYILPPVRAWENLLQAQRFSNQTGRKIILRLKFPDNAPKLEGHYNQARVLYKPYKLNNL